MNPPGHSLVCLLAGVKASHSIELDELNRQTPLPARADMPRGTFQRSWK
jgi:hypothetical protein